MKKVESGYEFRWLRNMFECRRLLPMPHMNGFELSEKILAIDINVKICFMSSGEINRQALRETYPSLSVGCFIRRPVTIDYLVNPH